MKAITLWQPWATLIAVGEKTVETRSWSTSYRGLVAIHASKRWTIEEVLTCWDKPFSLTLDRHAYYVASLRHHNLPLGCVVATAILTDCVPTESVDPTDSRRYALCEQQFGNYAPGRFAWVLKDISNLPEPIPARGAQGLWEWDAIGRETE